MIIVKDQSYEKKIVEVMVAQWYSGVQCTGDGSGHWHINRKDVLQFAVFL